ncbi:ABC transporter transmembrane domain-containing protein [Nonomuraea sp. NPDC049637]|uniref:ABC transporter transmembrane domain-containing protein n=1 Tax=Nonomuraea sp. NPDC049637 TaxID=3154356 RepID=UPI0034437EAC
MTGSRDPSREHRPTPEPPGSRAAVPVPPAAVPPPEPGTGGLLRPHVPAFVAVVVSQVIGAVAGLAPLLAVVEVGRVLLSPGPVDADRVRIAVLAGVAGLFVRLLLTGASSGLGHVLDGRVQLSLRRRLADRLGRVPLGWLSTRRTGELAKVVGEDVSAVHPFIAHAPGDLAAAFVVPAVSLAYLLTVDWRLTLITLIPVALALGLGYDLALWRAYRGVPLS